jgi:uncharacterized protein YegP (UPF0339 family)
MTDYVDVYKSRDGWRWRRRARNGLTISESGEAYVTLWGAKRAARRANAGVELKVVR